MGRPYYRAANLLSTEVIKLAMKEIRKSITDWKGGVLYFPSTVNGARAYLTTAQSRYQKTLAVVAVFDGFSKEEAGVMVGVSAPTVTRWIELYGDEIRSALKEVRGEDHDG